jgi:hypothetical protein
MNLQPKQQEALDLLFNPQTKYLLYGGAMAGGKSYLLRWAALYYALWCSHKYNIKGLPVGLFSEDYPTLKDRQISRIQREFPPYLGELKEDKNEGYAFFIREEYGGARILLRNLDDPSKYMSSEFAGEFVEELTRTPETTFQDLRNRLRFPGVLDVKFMGASNPGGVGHGWVRKFFVDKLADDPEQKRFSYVHANAYDNKYINPDYIKQLEALPLKKRKAYLEGSWDIFEGQVFMEFSRDIHVINPLIPKPEYARVAGIDWGYAAPTVLLVGAIFPQDYQGIKFSRLVLYREIDGIETTPEKWAIIFKRDMPEFSRIKFYGDPAMFNKLQDATFSIADQFRKDGVYVQKGSHNRLQNVESIHNWLSLAPDGEPYLKITDNCRHLIKTIPEAMYDENLEEQIDNDWAEDHWVDALSYLVSMLKWTNVKSGQFGFKDNNLLHPKFTIVNLKGEYVSLDPSRFADPYTKKRGVYFKE